LLKFIKHGINAITDKNIILNEHFYTMTPDRESISWITMLINKNQPVEEIFWE